MIHGVYTGGALLLSPQGLLLRGELLGEDLVVLPTDGDEEAFLVQITTAVAPSLDQVMHLGGRRGAPGAVDDNAAPVPVPIENLLANHRPVGRQPPPSTACRPSHQPNSPRYSSSTPRFGSSRIN